MDMPPRRWKGLERERESPYLLRSTCSMPVAVLNALRALSRLLLIAPLAPGQINVIIPMLHMREVRLRKITWPPQATQVVQSEFRARTSSVQKLGSCQCGRVRTPPLVRTPCLGQRKEAGPCSPERWTGDPLQRGKSGQKPHLLAGEEPDVTTRRQSGGWKARSSPITQGTLGGAGHSSESFVNRHVKAGGHMA